MISYFKEYKKIFLSLFVIVFILYGNSLRNKYALDDEYVTVTNFKQAGQNYVPNHDLVKRGFSGIKKIWKSRYAHDNDATFDYRPFVTTTFAIEYGIFGQNPLISHLINLLLYYSISCLLFLTLLRLFENYEFKFTIALITSLIFIIHPAHTEVVNNIKCRDELLALFFCLLAIWYSIQYFEKPSVKTLCLIFFLLMCGLLNKKSAMISFGVIPLCLYFYRKLSLKNTFILISVFLLTQIGFAVTRNSLVIEKAVRSFYHFENPLYTDSVTFFQKIIIAIKTLGFYVKFLIITFPFRFYYGVDTVDLKTLDFHFFVGILFLIGACIYLYKYKNKHFLFALLLFLGSIFPFLNFVSPVAGIVGERLCFFSTVGFCLLLTVILLQIFPNLSVTSTKQFLSKPLIYLLPVFVLCFFYIFNRNKNWYNKLTLFEHDAPYLENSSKANSLLANEYFEMLRSSEKKYPPQTLINKALKHYQLAILNDSSIYTAYNNAGVLYYSYLGDLNNAQHYFELAIQHKEKYAQANENLGNVYKSRQNYDTAIIYYLKAVSYNPKQYNSGFEIINSLNAQKKYQQSVIVCDIFLDTDLDDYSFLVLKANALTLDNQPEKAFAVYELAYHLKPNNELKTYMNSLEKK
ncbi:MAG: tetratricopeptide repeat protein [Bacteroidetes bacterium]|jgi:tetratricopeptide (TPR) repeat protein|nr:tetratricopeptide repeat protein [Bacteroidota bacterium]